jgi:hypothetical protein
LADGFPEFVILVAMPVSSMNTMPVLLAGPCAAGGLPSIRAAPHDCRAFLVWMPAKFFNPAAVADQPARLREQLSTLAIYMEISLDFRMPTRNLVRLLAKFAS